MKIADLTPDQIRHYYEARVPQVTARASGEASVCCPFHNDSNPSMSINLETGLWCCQAEGIGGNIVQFEKRLSGCEYAEATRNISEIIGVELAPPRGAAVVEAVYPYHDEQGRWLYDVVKKRLPNGKKTFVQRSRDAKGNFVYKTKGLVRLVPYRLNEIITAREVFIVEGEKCADAMNNRLRAAGCTTVIATCNPGGAGKWRDEFSPFFAGRKIVIIPDHDKPGLAHAQKVARSVLPYTAHGIKFVDLYEGEPVPENHGKDIADFLDAGGTIQDVLARIGKSPTLKKAALAKAQSGVLLSDIQAEKVEWLWPGRIPLGKLTILEGDPEKGKSLMAIDLAARVTNGSRMPDGTEGCQGGVVLLSAEDGVADTIRPRFDAAGGNPDLVLVLNTMGEGDEQRMINIPGDLDALEKAIVRVGAKLVIIDPLYAFLDGDVNSNNDQQVRQALAPLALLAERMEVALLVLRHLNKNEERSPINRGGGSVAFGAAARSVMVAAKDPDDENQFVLASVKNNLARRPDSLAYRTEEAENGSVRICWRGKSTHTADTLLAIDRQKKRPNKVDEAAEFLRDALADGPRSSTEVKAEAEANGIRPKTLRLAQETLEIVPAPAGFQGSWKWSLPKPKPKPVEGIGEKHVQTQLPMLDGQL